MQVISSIINKWTNSWHLLQLQSSKKDDNVIDGIDSGEVDVEVIVDCVYDTIKPGFSSDAAQATYTMTMWFGEKQCMIGHRHG